MKTIKILICSLVVLLSLLSCEVYSYATTQDDIYTETSADVVYSDVSFDIVVRYGVPFYRDNVILYYFYNGLYYYPFYYDNYWYVRTYRRPFAYVDRRPYFRPHRYDHRFEPGRYRGFGRPSHDWHYRNNHDGNRQHHGTFGNLDRGRKPNTGDSRFGNPGDRRWNNNGHGPDVMPNHSNRHPRGGVIDMRQKTQTRYGNFGGRR